MSEIEKIVKDDHKELKKPIVFIWKINTTDQNSMLISGQAEENYIWQLMVIIPKNYTNLDGESCLTPLS
ncbi:unnamed protein product [Blepharisma stoltei]|uniref:Uncharacterized protein n=1 Tax=Blepharisma stoltei TaxID=1481888 RepID=A0AAU9JL92_9CILI|nr:unnamed protein product [Blepharisma stoltei]